MIPGLFSGTRRKIGFFALSTLCVSCGSQPPASPVNAPDLETVKQTFKSPAVKSNPASNGESAVFPEALFDFGEALSGAIVEHEFAIRNGGAAPTVIEKVSMTTPLVVTGMPHSIAPGAEGKIHFKLDTADLQGNFEGTIVVSLSDPKEREARLAFRGHIVAPIELSPRPAFFVAGQRGNGNRAAIEIVNHQSQPLRIEKVQNEGDRFTTHLEMVTPGQRYRLTLALKPDGPVGRAASVILLKTSSKEMPLIKVGANTYLYERVHTFPDVVEFGRLRVGDASSVAVTMMIHQEGGKDFQARLSSDIPGLSFKLERGANGSGYQAEIILVPKTLKAGAMKGSVFIDTNDREFPRVIVPVSAEITER